VHDGERAAVRQSDAAMEGQTMKKRVLFICTENACRSQMAEAFLRQRAGERFDVYSAGTDPADGVNPHAIEAMKEVGIDISQQTPKPIGPLLGQHFNYVVTVCDPATQRCPIFPGVVKRLQWDVPDPAQAQGVREERMAVFRRVRDDIANRVRRFIEDEAA
jgi:arsenate reductase (thioredoxin)